MNKTITILSFSVLSIFTGCSEHSEHSKDSFNRIIIEKTPFNVSIVFTEKKEAEFILPTKDIFVIGCERRVGVAEQTSASGLKSMCLKPIKYKNGGVTTSTSHGISDYIYYLDNYRIDVLEDLKEKWALPVIIYVSEKDVEPDFNQARNTFDKLQDLSKKIGKEPKYDFPGLHANLPKSFDFYIQSKLINKSMVYTIMKEGITDETKSAERDNIAFEIKSFAEKHYIDISSIKSIIVHFVDKQPDFTVKHTYKYTKSDISSNWDLNITKN